MTAQQALQRLLAPILAPVPVVFADQNAEPPPKPYATLSVENLGSSGGYLTEGPLRPDGTAVFREHRTVNAEVQIYGRGAAARAAELGMRLRLPRHANRAADLGLGIAVVRGAMDVPALVNVTQYEERGVLEFTAHHVAELADDLGLIERAELHCPDGDGGAHTHLVETPPPAP